MDGLQDVVVEEGDELVEYVVIDLPAGVASKALAPGQLLTLEDLQSDQPRLRLPDGRALVGTYEEHLGTIMLFSQQEEQQLQQVGDPQGVGAAAADLTGVPPGTGQGQAEAAAAAARQQEAGRVARPALAYRCLTEKVLSFAAVS